MTHSEINQSQRTPANPLQLSIVIPAYLEAESLRSLLPTIKVGAAALTPDFEILIIDTQQPMDDTAVVCAISQVRHLHRTMMWGHGSLAVSAPRGS